MPDFTSNRTTINYLSWVKAEFAPLTLATPDTSLEQLLENAIRYLNTHSAFKISQVLDYPAGTSRVQVSAAMKKAVACYPTKITQYNWNTHPLFTLTGVAILDNVTTDLILQSVAFKDLRTYVGANFQWWFQDSDDPETGGYIYCINQPAESQSIFVVGTRRITSTEDIENEQINDWLLRYFKALVKIQEGHTLRTAAIININSKGNELLNEGKKEKEDLEKELMENSKWVVMMPRK